MFRAPTFTGARLSIHTMLRGIPRRPRPCERPTVRRRAFGALVASLLLAPVSALAQANDHALMRTEILDSLVLENDADMDFGDLIPGSADGAVVMTPSATATCGTNNGIVHSGACRAAEFSGNASFLFLLRIERPAGNQITLVGPGGATMRLDTFTFGIGSGLTTFANGNGPPHQQRYRVYSFDGSFTFYVGGTLRVARNQAPGIYNGTFSITMNYD